MSPSLISSAAKLGAAICAVLVVLAAWSLYQNPAMGLMLATFSFCG